MINRLINNDFDSFSCCYKMANNSMIMDLVFVSLCVRENRLITDVEFKNKDKTKTIENIVNYLFLTLMNNLEAKEKIVNLIEDFININNLNIYKGTKKNIDGLMVLLNNLKLNESHANVFKATTINDDKTIVNNNNGMFF